VSPVVVAQSAAIERRSAQKKEHPARDVICLQNANPNVPSKKKTTTTKTQPTMLARSIARSAGQPRTDLCCNGTKNSSDKTDSKASAASPPSSLL